MPESASRKGLKKNGKKCKKKEKKFWGVPAHRGVCSGGVCSEGGVSTLRGSAPGGCLLPGGLFLGVSAFGGWGCLLPGGSAPGEGGGYPSMH